jgi:hypothetical protein
MDDIRLDWPQIVVLCLWGYGLIIAAVKDGEIQSERKHKFGVSLVCVIIAASLLYFGGFFTEIPHDQ